MLKTGKELATEARKVAENYNTIYIKGCFGWPMNQANKNRAIASYAYNAKKEREEKIQSCREDTFGFDCVCLVKALLWGWYGNSEHNYGGCTYASNGVPDKNEKQMLDMCLDVTESFATIQQGEVVWLPGHMGIYIGDGLAVEATPNWKDGVQITAVHNIGQKIGYNGRSWVKHGKLPYLTYDPTPDHAFTVTLRELCKGMAGNAVCSLQQLLIAKGYSCGKWGADGEFGNGTLQAVKSYQKEYNLSVDGIVGQKTMESLLGGVSYE